MIHKQFLRKENSQIQKSYLDGWNQSLHNLNQVCTELEVFKKRSKKK